MNRLIQHLTSVAVLAAFAFPTAANACTVCMGDANSNVAGAANGAIFVMLGVIGSMLAAMVAFGFYIYRRSLQPLPPHLAFVETLNHEDGTASHA